MTPAGSVGDVVSVTPGASVGEFSIPGTWTDDGIGGLVGIEFVVGIVVGAVGTVAVDDASVVVWSPVEPGCVPLVLPPSLKLQSPWMCPSPWSAKKLKSVGVKSSPPYGHPMHWKTVSRIRFSARDRGLTLSLIMASFVLPFAVMVITLLQCAPLSHCWL